MLAVALERIKLRLTAHRQPFRRFHQRLIAAWWPQTSWANCWVLAVVIQRPIGSLFRCDAFLMDLQKGRPFSKSARRSNQLHCCRCHCHRHHRPSFYKMKEAKRISLSLSLFRVQLIAFWFYYLLITVSFQFHDKIPFSLLILTSQWHHETVIC